MENYIVRIYRREQDNPEEIAGQVEDVEDGSVYAFDSIDCLDDIFLRAPRSLHKNKSRKRAEIISLSESMQCTVR